MSEHWLAFGARTSPLTGSPRSAANPANALLNYLYAMLDAEARIALLAVGLDPGLWVLHADLRARDSLALDLMEAVRPQVDAYVLGLLRLHTFAALDFFETRQGVCQVPAADAPTRGDGADLGPCGRAARRRCRRALFRSISCNAQRDLAMLTPLTGANRSAGREAARRPLKRPTSPPRPDLSAACDACGSVLTASGRAFCDDCLSERHAEAVAVFTTARPADLAVRRAAGEDPADGNEAGRQRGRRNADHIRANAEWERSNPRPDSVIEFARDILPELQSAPLSALVKVPGLSLRYCSLILRELRQPHPRHWKALTQVGILGGADPGDPSHRRTRRAAP